jgi:uncharacterized membrane protein (DUF485 family)
MLIEFQEGNSRGAARIASPAGAPVFFKREVKEMASELTQRIQRNPQYQHLTKTRNTLGWLLTIVTCIAYYGFVLVIAFDKTLFAAPIGEGWTTTWGIPAGFGVILLTIVVVAVYVRKANRDYDGAIKEILAKEVQQ